jgi:hypothetical protein
MNMKRLFLSIFLVTGITGFAFAQSHGNNSSSRTTGAISNNDTSTTNTTKKNNKKAPSATKNNRKNYEWKNGQKATPTGQEATGSNSNGFASLKKDTGTVQPKKKEE